MLAQKKLELQVLFCDSLAESQQGLWMIADRIDIGRSRARQVCDGSLDQIAHDEIDHVLPDLLHHSSPRELMRLRNHAFVLAPKLWDLPQLHERDQSGA